MLHLEEVWDEEMNDEGGDLYEESNLVITWELCTILIFIVMWQFCFGISDAGVTALFLFLSKFFHLILLKYNGEGFLHQFCNSFPKTIKRAFSLLVIGNDTFTKFIVCPLCDSVFEFNFGYTMERGVKVPKRCPHVKMPNHPMASQRQPCGALLMKTLRGSNGNLTIDVKPQVGRILKFMKHAIKISESNELIDKVHIFCITEWYMKHHSENHYGSSATVCFPFGYTADSCQFMPIQRICNQCAHANIAVNLSGRAEENVLVAIPIHLKYCV